MLRNRTLVNDPVSTLNEFKDQFESVFQPSNIVNLEYGDIRVNDGLCQDIFSVVKLGKAFDKLSIKYTEGTDRLSSLLIKYCKPAFVGPLRMIAIQALKTGIHPDK